jgi:UDP-N-acetylglucosamine diphosphorylase/glucosamine-1-phosphate N-acetyltransferase
MARLAWLFDDGGGVLSPLTDLRPVFAVRTGALTTRERLAALLGVTWAGLWVRPAHEAMARSRVGEVPINAVPTAADAEAGGGVLLVNGRCVLPAVASDGRGIEGLKPGEFLEAEGVCVAACLSPAAAGEFLRGLAGGRMLPTGARGISAAGGTGGAAVLSRPWHVRTYRDACIAADLGLLVPRVLGVGGASAVPSGVMAIGGKGLAIHPTAKVYPGVVLDCEAGAVVIDEHAVLRPACTVIGPAYIGAHSTVLDRAIVKGNTAIGPQCKVAGEVGGTIFHGFANKAHDGHLGDAWVGKWANLGAGTTNSNLLNTYGEVTMRATPTGKMERTGQQFMGAIIGDHVKTAICTRIMTGTLIGTGAMIATSAAASGTVPAFAWCTDEGRQSFRLDKFVQIAKTVMSRRKVEAGEAYWAAVGALHGGEGGRG